VEEGVRRAARSSPFYLQMDRAPASQHASSMTLYWNVMLHNAYIAEFLTDTPLDLNEVDKQIAINLCIVRYGGFFEEELK